MVTDVDVAPFIPRTTGRPRRRWPSHLYAYLYLAPAVILLLALTVYPLLRTFNLSVHDVNLLRADRGFVGLSNFTAQLGDTASFWPALLHSVIWVVGSVGGEYMLGLLSAVLLNLPLRGRGLFRMLILIPWTVPIVIAAMTWKWMLDPSFGIVNVALVNSGLMGQPKFWLGNVDTALASAVFINVWRSFPFYTISLLAAMQSIPQDLYEAAALDGAGAWQRFVRITLPHIKGVSIALIILHIIWTFNNVDFIWLLTQGGPLYATETLATMVYRRAFTSFEMSDAAALSVLMIAFLMVVGGIWAWANRRLAASEAS